MPRRVMEAIEQGADAFYIGHRLILPFKCNIIKLIFESTIYTEMVGSENIKLHQDEMNTSIYIRSAGKLANYFDTYKVIKLVVCDYDADLTDRSTHIKLVCEIEEDHLARLSLPTDDLLFIE